MKKWRKTGMDLKGGEWIENWVRARRRLNQITTQMGRDNTPHHQMTLQATERTF